MAGNGHCETHHGVLQRLLVACGPVLGPLRPLGVNVAQQQLLDLPSVVAVLVLRLHSYESQLHHGKAHRRQTRPACPAVVELEVSSHRHPVQGKTHAGGRQTGGQSLLGRLAVHYDGHLAQMVIGLGGPAGDPGGVTQPQLSPDAEGVGGFLAAAVCVVVLQGLEVTAGVEGVGAGEELRPWSDFAPEHRGEKWKNCEKSRQVFAICSLSGHKNMILFPRIGLKSGNTQ